MYITMIVIEKSTQQSDLSHSRVEAYSEELIFSNLPSSKELHALPVYSCSPFPTPSFLS